MNGKMNYIQQYCQIVKKNDTRAESQSRISADSKQTFGLVIGRCYRNKYKLDKIDKKKKIKNQKKTGQTAKIEFLYI